MSAFKGRLTNSEACLTVNDALTRLSITSHVLPIGDGGAGTVLAVQSALGGEFQSFSAQGPLGDTVTARVLLIPSQVSPTVAYIESSETCGFTLVKPSQRDAMAASSRGLGEVIRQTLSHYSSIKQVYIGLGDSAISDAGLGMLLEVGVDIRNSEGKLVQGNARGLEQVRKIEAKSLWPGIKFTVLCDVDNPLCGERGSARTFSPQKGASADEVVQIANGMEQFASVIEQTLQMKVALRPRCGSAGGLSSALFAFFNAELVSGASFLFDWIQFAKIIKEFDHVIVGEGKTDAQTLSGKAPFEIIQRAHALKKRVTLISGVLGDGHQLLKNYCPDLRIFACGDEPTAHDALVKTTIQAFSGLSPKSE